MTGLYPADGLMQMERLNKLREEYEQIKSRLNFPLDLAERHELYERRRHILVEAQTLAASLDISGDHWFNSNE